MQNQFESVKKLHQSIFESLIVMYDYNLDGTLEAIEHGLEDLILEKIVADNVYLVLLVFARITHKTDDQIIRRKI